LVQPNRAAQGTASGNREAMPLAQACRIDCQTHCNAEGRGERDGAARASKIPEASPEARGAAMQDRRSPAPKGFRGGRRDLSVLAIAHAGAWRRSRSSVA